MLDKNLIKMSLASSADFYEIKHFLKQHKESSPSRNDLVYTVRYQKKLIGLARLINIEDTIKPQYWLRGLFIEQEYRQQHLASHLLDYIGSNLETRLEHFEILAFPYNHLKQFYERNGFTLIGLNHLPLSLQNTYKNALNQGKTWLCMVSIY